MKLCLSCHSDGALLLCCALVLAIGGGGCAGNPAPFQSTTVPPRVYNPPVPIVKDGGRSANPASLWPIEERSRVVEWGDRPERLGDMVHIQVDETFNAAGGASTDTMRESQNEAQLGALLGLASKLPTEGDRQALLSAGLIDKFQATGQTSRESRISATFPAFVTKVLDNGLLFVEGQKHIRLNQEESVLYISGVIRPVDIDAGNIVRSSRIGDADARVFGSGVISENNQPGWLKRLWNWISPF